MKLLLMCCLLILSASGMPVRAGADSITPPSSTTTVPPSNTRYGLFDALDHRSSYGDNVFPEPFIVDDTVLEVNEARLDWLHTAGEGNQHSDLVAAEVEKGF